MDRSCSFKRACGADDERALARDFRRKVQVGDGQLLDYRSGATRGDETSNETMCAGHDAVKGSRGGREGSDGG